MSFGTNLTRRRRRRGFTNSQITRRYNSARIYGRRVLGYSGCTRAAIQTGGENGGTNVRELTMYGVCALSETQIAMRTQRRPDEIRSTCERVKLVRAIHVCRPVDTRAPLYNQRDCNWGCAEFNRILIFLFVRRRMRCTRAARLHEKCWILSILDTGTGVSCDSRADYVLQQRIKLNAIN